MAKSNPVALGIIVVALVGAGGLLMWGVQSLTRVTEPAASRSARPAIAPLRPAAQNNGAVPAVVEVATLRDAIVKADWATFKAVLDKGVDINAPMRLFDESRRQMPLLTFAAMQGSTEGVRQLLAAGADPDNADATGTTPLMMAAARGDPDMIKALVDAKARVDRADKWGQTALMLAALAGEADNVAALLDAGADVKLTDEEGNSALAKAAGSDAPAAIITLLVRAGAPVDAASSDGVTPLMRAAERAELDKVVALLNAGAKADARDRDGRTAVDWALQRADEAGKRVAEVLSQAGR